MVLLKSCTQVFLWLGDTTDTTTKTREPCHRVCCTLFHTPSNPDTVVKVLSEHASDWLKYDATCGVLQMDRDRVSKAHMCVKQNENSVDKNQLNFPFQCDLNVKTM